MMKAMFGFSFLLIIFSLSAFSAEFSSLQIQGWKKEELSHDHLRFSKASDHDVVIHIQVDSYDPKNHWSASTLKEDVLKMEKMRNSMSFFMAMKEYRITNSSFAGNLLDLEGSYIAMGKRKVVFKELNFYQQEHFLQIKFISDSTLPSTDEIKKIVSELKPDQVEID